MVIILIIDVIQIFKNEIMIKIIKLIIRINLFVNYVDITHDQKIIFENTTSLNDI